MIFKGFVGPSYISQSPYADCEDLVNFYVEEIESNGRTAESALYPTPGVTEIYAGATGPGRAHWAQNGREFAVLGSSLVEMTSVPGAAFVRGTVSVNSNPATISWNGDAGDQLFITSGGDGYVFNLTTNTLTAIASMTGRCTMGDFLDGYFLSLNSNTGILYISDLLDGSTWDTGAQFLQNSITQDDWISMKVANRNIYLGGESTTQVWYDAGTFPIPFALHPSGVMQYGVAAKFSPKIVGGALCWLSSTQNGQGAVIRTGGFTPEVISTAALHWAFSNYSTLSDAIGDSYEDSGHTFYTLTFPTANVTWAWDTRTGWAKRGTWDTSTNSYDVWRPCFHAFVFGQHRVLDVRGNSIYQMSSNFFYDVLGKLIRRVRRSPSVVDENNLVSYSKLELDVQPGLADMTGQGSAPIVRLRYSNDNGMNWSNWIDGSPGLRGQYGARCEWNRLGAGRRRVFEVVMTDPVPWRIMGAFVDMKRSIKGQSAAA